MDKLTFTSEDGEVLEFFVLEETRVQETNYLLVADTEEEDGNCYILKDTSGQEAEEAEYEFVDNDNELNVLTKIFTELLEDTDIQM